MVQELFNWSQAICENWLRLLWHSTYNSRSPSRRNPITIVVLHLSQQFTHGTDFCRLESYVDDSKLFMPFPHVELDAAIEKLEQDLYSVAQWCCEDHLLINPDKTKLLFLGTRQMLSRLPEDPGVVFLGKTLKPTDSSKDLGVFLDPHLTYDHHISCVVSSCIAKLCQINRVKRNFDKETLELLITSLVSRKFDHVTPLLRELNWLPVKE